MAILELDHASLSRGVRVLSARDADLARVAGVFGPPPLWQRAPGFPTLVHIMLEQQVSLASARAAFGRLRAAVRPLTPINFLKLSDTELKAIGFSAQKTGYCRGLAETLLAGALDLPSLRLLPDVDARARLMQVRGIGPWTADIYLLMALRRPDIWPSGDLALVAAVARLKRMRLPLSAADLTRVSDPWRPWRAVAARLLWHFYLSAPRATVPVDSASPRSGRMARPEARLCGAYRNG